ncbi:coiled-coil domain-containing protein 169 isoform X5 [Hemicordylus capensis]|uniref:coiled-coil domain-containing protein 169 isoform X5 n=1 Tax=Hemicordylus capensis TaxID=884348 RepID=UPI0023035225|nr:coiled-coil domain-containing protein 169 isoform X5 [Hemicordylus capensis]
MGEAAACSQRLDPEQIVLELKQEQQMKQMLEHSIYEMKNTMAELEKRLGSVEDEDNEWKTRYETQIEFNRQLKRQIGLLQGKMEHVRGSPTDRLASVRSFDQMHLYCSIQSHPTPGRIQLMELYCTSPSALQLQLENTPKCSCSSLHQPQLQIPQKPAPKQTPKHKTLLLQPPPSQSSSIK